MELWISGKLWELMNIPTLVLGCDMALGERAWVSMQQLGTGKGAQTFTPQDLQWPQLSWCMFSMVGGCALRQFCCGIYSNWP